MAGEGINVGHILDLASSGTGPAHAPRKGDHKASVATLIWANLQHLWRDDAVEACPIRERVMLMNFAGQCRHQGNGICFAMGQCHDLSA